MRPRGCTNGRRPSHLLTLLGGLWNRNGRSECGCLQVRLPTLSTFLLYSRSRRWQASKGGTVDAPRAAQGAQLLPRAEQVGDFPSFDDLSLRETDDQTRSLVWDGIVVDDVRRDPLIEGVGISGVDRLHHAPVHHPAPGLGRSGGAPPAARRDPGNRRSGPRGSSTEKCGEPRHCCAAVRTRRPRRRRRTRCDLRSPGSRTQSMGRLDDGERASHRRGGTRPPHRPPPPARATAPHIRSGAETPMSSSVRRSTRPAASVRVRRARLSARSSVSTRHCV